MLIAELASPRVTPLAVRSAFAGTIAFYAVVVLPLARRELGRWRQRALAIPDATLRQRAIATVENDHLTAEGAAAFAVLHPWAARELIPLLVAYQLLWDFVDTVLERPTPSAGDRETVCKTLELALTPEREQEQIRVAPASANGGFFGELVDACRKGCAALPSYSEARPALRRAVARSDALLLTNGTSENRMQAIRAWARRHPVEDGQLDATEVCAAAHSSLAIHALLATASIPRSRPHQFRAIEAAYFPWISALSTLLDSVVDQEDDRRTNGFSFVSQYPSRAHARERLKAICDRALKTTPTLPAANRHRVLLCAVVGMYLSKSSARASQVQPLAESVLDATAPLSTWARAVVGAQRRTLRLVTAD